MNTRHVLAVGALAAGSLLVGAAPVQAGVAQPLVVDIDDHLPYVRDAATFDFSVDTNEDEACDASLELVVLDSDEQPVTDVTIDEGAGTITFGPSVTGGDYVLEATCTTASEEEISSGDGMAFARGLVTKVVEGDPAPGTTFTVELACTGEDTPFTEELEFGTAGGTDFIAVYDSQTCDVTEPEDGGAEEVAISGDLEFPDPADFTVTVTNTFADAPAPTPPAPPAPAAQPQVVQPTFTG